MAEKSETCKYDKKEICNSCGAHNEVKQIDGENGVVYECETICKSCGFEDYWAFGFFQSRQYELEEEEELTQGK